MSLRLLQKYKQIIKNIYIECIFLYHIQSITFYLFFYYFLVEMYCKLLPVVPPPHLLFVCSFDAIMNVTDLCVTVSMQ